MIDIKKYIISKGEQMEGIMWEDIQRHILTPAEYDKFQSWMRGQTMGCLDEACKISLVYVGDLERFMRGLRVID